MNRFNTKLTIILFAALTLCNGMHAGDQKTTEDPRMAIDFLCGTYSASLIRDDADFAAADGILQLMYSPPAPYATTPLAASQSRAFTTKKSAAHSSKRKKRTLKETLQELETSKQPFERMSWQRTTQTFKYWLYKKGDISTAYKIANITISRAKEAGNEKHITQASYILAQVLEKDGKPKEALEQYKLSQVKLAGVAAKTCAEKIKQLEVQFCAEQSDVPHASSSSAASSASALSHEHSLWLPEFVTGNIHKRQRCATGPRTPKFHPSPTLEEEDDDDDDDLLY